MTEESKSNSWWVSYQNQIDYYESQQVALVAIDLIMSRCEGEIWHGDSHLYLSHQQGETIDRDLFNSRYSTRVMIATSYEYMFRIDLFVKNKEDWIFNYGSDLLQQSILAGYECNERYLQERVALDYPGFMVNSGTYRKVDSPSESCLYACLGYENAYCSSDYKNYYITIDNFLGKYQLIKLIDSPLKIAEENSIVQTAIDNSFITKIGRYKTLNNSSLVVITASVSTILVGLFTILYVLYVAQLSG
jgi:hypothetical protein